MRKLIFMTWLFLFASPCAFATWQGNLWSSTDLFSENLGPPTSMVVPRLGLELDDLEKFTKSYRFSFKGSFQTNLETKYAPENYFGDIQEAYFEVRRRKFKFRLGYNTVNWGILDIYSPMDVVNQSVYFDPMNLTKRGAPMVDLEWNPRGWSFSAVYIPWQQHAMLPSNDSRWYPRNTLQNVQTNAGLAELPRPVQYGIEPYQDIDHSLYNNWGVNMVKRWESLDLHAMYFEGTTATPTFDIDLPNMTYTLVDPTTKTIAITGPVLLRPIFYRTRTSGFGFSSNLGDVILRGETAYTSTFTDAGSMDFSDWSWQSGAGLEKNWEIGPYTVTQIIHYYHGQLPHTADNLPTSGFRLFDDAAMMGFRCAVSDQTNFYGSILYNFPQQGIFWMVGYQSQLTDAVKWDISWRAISANRPGLLQTYADNDHAALNLTYFF